jgi:HEPN domain-containing protein
MSQSDDAYQATRWLDTAGDDLRAAEALAQGALYAHACFHAQQAAEKAVKAAWVMLGEAPWGHSIQALVRGFPGAPAAPDWIRWQARAAALDRFYIPTRYPDGLPDLTPSESYFEADAVQALVTAREFVEATRRWMGEKRI